MNRSDFYNDCDASIIRPLHKSPPSSQNATWPSQIPFQISHPSRTESGNVKFLLRLTIPVISSNIWYPSNPQDPAWMCPERTTDAHAKRRRACIFSFSPTRAVRPASASQTRSALVTRFSPRNIYHAQELSGFGEKNNETHQVIWKKAHESPHIFAAYNQCSKRRFGGFAHISWR